MSFCLVRATGTFLLRFNSFHLDPCWVWIRSDHIDMSLDLCQKCSTTTSCSCSLRGDEQPDMDVTHWSNWVKPTYFLHTSFITNLLLHIPQARISELIYWFHLGLETQRCTVVLLSQTGCRRREVVFEVMKEKINWCFLPLLEVPPPAHSGNKQTDDLLPW